MVTVCIYVKYVLRHQTNGIKARSGKVPDLRGFRNEYFNQWQRPLVNPFKLFWESNKWYKSEVGQGARPTKLNDSLLRSPGSQIWN